MIRILRTENDIRTGIVEEQVRNRLVGDEACFRTRDGRHGVVVLYNINLPWGPFKYVPRRNDQKVHYKAGQLDKRYRSTRAAESKTCLGQWEYVYMFVGFRVLGGQAA